MTHYSLRDVQGGAVTVITNGVLRTNQLKKTFPFKVLLNMTQSPKKELVIFPGGGGVELTVNADKGSVIFFS